MGGIPLSQSPVLQGFVAAKADLEEKVAGGYFKGDKGDTGAQGIKGDRGDTGQQGLPGAGGGVIPSGVYLQRAANVLPGTYYGDASIGEARTISRVFAQVKAGTGTVVVAFRTDTTTIYGPFTVSTTAVDGALNVPLPMGTNIYVDVDTPSGTVTQLIAKIEGRPS